MYIYSELPYWIKTFQKTKEPEPFKFKAEFHIVYLGSADIVEVEIKRKADELGWLYEATIALLHHDNILYEVRMAELKQYAEAALKDKRFVTADEPNAVGKIRVEDTNRVVGYLDKAEVMKLAKPIPDED